MTSRDLVNIATGAVRHQFRSHDSAKPGREDVSVKRKPPKVGHAGTLDPLAEGVLVLGIGGASRLTSYLQQTDKSYEARFRLGCSSVSGDLEETVVPHPEMPVPTIDQLRQAARGMTGRVRQTPPAHSAIKIGGRRAYQMAREGADVTVPSREVLIHEFQVTRYEYPDVWLRITCGSGTYIRTMGMDLAKRCHTAAVMTHLVRTRVGRFELDSAIDVESLRQGEWVHHLCPAAIGVAHLPKLCLTTEQSWRIDHGLTLTAGEVDFAAPESLASQAANVTDNAHVAALDPDGRLRAIVTLRSDQWRPIRVFHD